MFENNMPNDRLILRLNSRKVQFLPTLVENANRSWASIKTERKERHYSVSSIASRDNFRNFAPGRLVIMRRNFFS